MPTLSDISGSVFLVGLLRERVVGPLKGGGDGASRRVIVYGPPGTGKTFIARAVAGELGLGFRKVSPHDAAKDVMNFARYASRQTLVFFDELEWVNYRPVYLEALLGVSKDVLVVGATNYPWRVQGLLKAGFDCLIFMPEPDLEARKGILSHHLGVKSDSLDIGRLAELTSGYTASDIYHLCEWVQFRGQVTQVKLEAAISEYRNVQLREWVAEAEANRGSLDAKTFRPLLEWLEEKRAK
jgi:SpoVK/Ycf46/Vps4 family AAA+-type ATPase